MNLSVLDLRGHRVPTRHLEDIALSSLPNLVSMGQCETCGEYVRLEPKEGSVTATSSCAYPNGPEVFETHVDVPSGRCSPTPSWDGVGRRGR